MGESWVVTQTHLGQGRTPPLPSCGSPHFTLPRWLGAGLTQALGSSHMGLASSEDLPQDRGAEWNFLGGEDRENSPAGQPGPVCKPS